jgi:hypothetical protein
VGSGAGPQLISIHRCPRGPSGRLLRRRDEQAQVSHLDLADGFVAGPNQSDENPLGEGGERLHDWAVSLAAWRESHDKRGAR